MTIAIVGKYTSLLDAYQVAGGSACAMAASATTPRSTSTGSTARSSRREDAVQHLEGVHGILVPGGFGERGSEGKIQAAQFARERKIPYFGICFGMQMAVIEAARHLRRRHQGRVDASLAPARSPWSV